MKACFIGHKSIEITEELKISLKDTVEMLINNGVTTFLFGSMSDFDDLSWEAVTEFKQRHSFIKRVYVRSAYQYIEKFYEEYLLELYEDTYFPSQIEKAGKYSYVERNYEMIDNSTYCVFYYNENYVPLKQPFKNSIVANIKRKSGTKIAYEYAVKKKKEIINLYKR